MTHVHFIENELTGDLIDIRYFCSQSCALNAGGPQPSAWAGGMEIDYDQHCDNCGDFIAAGLAYA